MFARLTGRLWVFTVAIVLLGGCTGGKPPADDEKPGDEGSPASPWTFNQSLPFQRGAMHVPSFFAQGPVWQILIGSHDRPSTMGPPGGPVFVATANITFKEWARAEVAPAGLDFAGRGPLWAHATQDTVLVTANLRQNAPEGHAIDEWVTLASLKNASWSVEEKPERWRGQAATGVTHLGEATYVLTWHRRLLSWSLWKYADETWTQELLNDLSGVHGAAVASNGTHLFVAGGDSGGNSLLLERTALNAAFKKTILQAGNSLDVLGLTISSTWGRAPSVQWGRATLDPTASTADRTGRFLARFHDGAWEIENLAALNGTTSALASILGVDYVLTSTSNHNELWRRNETAWNRCQIGNDFWPVDVGLIHNATSAMLVFVPIGPEYRARAVILDNYSATCVPSGMGPLLWKP